MDCSIVVADCRILWSGRELNPLRLYSGRHGRGGCDGGVHSCARRQARVGSRGQDRIGGRVHTVDFAGGLVELGAEWTQGTVDSRIYNMALQHNVTLLSQPQIFEVLRSDGSVADPAIKDVLDKGFEFAEDPDVDKPQPLGEYVTNKLMDYINDKHPELAKDKDTITRILDYLDLYVDSVDASNSWMDVDASAPYKVLDGDQHLSWHTLGFKTMFDIMLNTYKGGPGLPTLKVELRSPAARVEWSHRMEEPVRVTCTDGRQYTADTAVVTVSLGVLKEKHATMFSPPLPSDKVAAIENLPMGVIGKIILSFDKKWWGDKFYGMLWRPEDIKTVPEEDRWTTRIMGLSEPMGCQKAITLWTSGDAAKLVETLPEEVVKTKLTALLRRFIAVIDIPDPIAMLRSKWYSNEWTRGAYSYTGMATGTHEARLALAAPLRDDSGRARVMFAGEATSVDRYATVHGAADTGAHAASLLLDTMNTTT